MLVLIGIGLLAGLVTAISPCVLPVLPILLAGGASGRRPLRIITGLIASAVGGSELTRRVRTGAAEFRAVSGVVMAAVALGLVFHLDDHLTGIAPGYLTFVQNKVENSKTARRHLAELRGGKQVAESASGALQHYGTAPNFEADGDWINSAPLTTASLHGKVVLVDFWTYSCIN